MHENNLIHNILIFYLDFLFLFLSPFLYCYSSFVVMIAVVYMVYIVFSHHPHLFITAHYLL